jgi:hypothetical protein
VNGRTLHWAFEFNRGALNDDYTPPIGSRKGANLVNWRLIFGVFESRQAIRGDRVATRPLDRFTIFPAESKTAESNPVSLVDGRGEPGLFLNGKSNFELPQRADSSAKHDLPIYRRRIVDSTAAVTRRSA